MIVNVKVVEGERTRIQAYEGVCIGRSGHGLNESFTVRKISYGEGVERVFPLLVADDRLDQARAPRQGAPRQALLPARPARQSRRASPRARTTAARARTSADAAEVGFRAPSACDKAGHRAGLFEIEPPA